MNFTSLISALLAVVVSSACGSSGGFGGSADQKTSAKRSSAGTAKEVTTQAASNPENDEEGILAEQSSSVSGAFLVGCGPADVAITGVAEDSEVVGCGVYDKGPRTPHKGVVTFQDVIFRASEGAAEVVTQADWTEAPKGSFYHAYAQLPKGRFETTASIKGGFAVGGASMTDQFVKQKFAGDWSAIDVVVGVDDPTDSVLPANPCLQGPGAKLNLRAINALPTPVMNPDENYARDNLTDGDLQTSWTSKDFKAQIFLTWPEDVPVCQVTLTPDYGHLDGNGNIVNDGEISVKIQVGSGFDVVGNLENSKLFFEAQDLQVKRGQGNVLAPVTQQSNAGSALVMIENCAPSWCALYEIEFYGPASP